MSRFNMRIEPGERLIVLTAFAYFFLILGGYSLLKPLRDTMGIAGGTAKLPWMLTATFVATAIGSWGFAALLDRVPRWRAVPWLYVALAGNLLLFQLWIAREFEPVWSARCFFVWVSVYNLFLTSIFWSLMADLFSVDQAKRLYGLIAAGGSAGAICGPAVTTILVTRVAPTALLPISALTLLLAAWLVRRLDRLGASARTVRPAEPLSGNALQGLGHALSNPYLLGITATTVMYTFTSTQLYLQQAAIVERSISAPAERTAFFATIDLWANTLTVILQLVITGPLLQRLGTVAGLLVTPIVTGIGLAWLGTAPSLAALRLLQVSRRAVHYAFERPARESLYNLLSPEDKYKSKNAIDTVIYRTSDAASAWGFQGLATIGTWANSLIGVLASSIWAGFGYFLAGRQARLLSARREPVDLEASGGRAVVADTKPAQQ